MLPLEFMATSILLLILIAEGLFESVVDWLNIKQIDPKLPDEFRGTYDDEKYRKSQEYLKVRTRFGLIQRVVGIVGLIAFVLIGGFNQVDLWARGFGYGPVLTGLLFIGTLSLLASILSLPFSVYSTFVVEERFGFNRTTVKTFISDLVKGAALGVILGGPLIGLVLWFFETMGTSAWLWVWITVTAFQLIMMFLAPAFIMPLFNKYTPLPPGELRDAIENFARSQNFGLGGLFTMDGSRRSSKSNAFFTGFGRFRRIVLFDTLIERQTVNELVAVLAHEIGHYKKRHIFRQLGLSIVVTALTFFLMSLFLENPFFFDAFLMENISIYGSLVFFSLFYTPVSRILSLYGLYLSRKYEFEADAFARATYGHSDALVSALKKLSVENLSNLTPHPLKVFVDYTHPPVLERIKALRLGS
jgi:STE24 endopeptidase